MDVFFNANATWVTNQPAIFNCDVIYGSMYSQNKLCCATVNPNAVNLIIWLQ
jgi:hypothetical protein